MLRRDFNFSKEIIASCLDFRENRITVTLRDFSTQALSVDLTAKHGQSISESLLFTDREFPDVPMGTILGNSGEIAIVRSRRDRPPAVFMYWFSVWNLPLGIPLSDRALYLLVDADEKNVPVNDARIVGDDQAVAFTYSPQGNLQDVVDILDLEPRNAAQSWLPSFMEALVGMRIDASDNFEPVADRIDALWAGRRQVSAAFSATGVGR